MADKCGGVCRVGGTREIINGEAFPAISGSDGAPGSGVDVIDQAKGELAEIEVIEVDC